MKDQTELHGLDLVILQMVIFVSVRTEQMLRYLDSILEVRVKSIRFRHILVLVFLLTLHLITMISSILILIQVLILVEAKQKLIRAQTMVVFNQNQVTFYLRVLKLVRLVHLVGYMLTTLIKYLQTISLRLSLMVLTQLN